MDGKLTKESLEQDNLTNEEESLPEDETSEENKSTDEEEFAEDIPSPLKSAVLLAVIEGKKQEYTNDSYLNEILVIYKENPEDEPQGCFYVTASLMMFRMRLNTAHEPKLTMERLAIVSSLNKWKDIPEHMCSTWELVALNGGARRMFNYILSYIINHPLYVLNLSTNQWREYDLSVANHEQTQFHSDFVQEHLPFNFIGPPFMLAEHLEQDSAGNMNRTHVAALMHEFFYDANDRLHGTDVLRFKDYISLMKHPLMRKEYPFVFAGDLPNLTAEPE